MKTNSFFTDAVHCQSRKKKNMPVVYPGDRSQGLYCSSPFLKIAVQVTVSMWHTEVRVLSTLTNSNGTFLANSAVMVKEHNLLYLHGQEFQEKGLKLFCMAAEGKSNLIKWVPKNLLGNQLK